MQRSELRTVVLSRRRLQLLLSPLPQGRRGKQTTRQGHRKRSALAMRQTLAYLRWIPTT